MTKPKLAVAYFILGFGVLILLFGLLVAKTGAIKLLLMPLSIGLFLIAFFIAARVKIASEVSAVSELLSSLGIEEDKIRLPFEAKIEYGILTLAHYRPGYMDPEVRSRESRTIYRFKKAGEVITDEFPFVDAEFQLIADENREGFISVPAVKVRDLGVWFLFLTNQGKADTSLTLVASKDSDYVQVALKGSGRRIEGEIHGILESVKRVQVTVGSKEFKFKKIILMSSKESGQIGKKFSFDVLPDEKLLLIIPDVYTTFQEVASLLSEALSPPIIMGHGDFVITIKLDVPHGRDVVEEGPLRLCLRVLKGGDLFKILFIDAFYCSSKLYFYLFLIKNV